MVLPHCHGTVLVHKPIPLASPYPLLPGWSTTRAAANVQAGGSPPGIQCDGALEQGLLCAESADCRPPIGVACQSHRSHVQASCSMGQVPYQRVTLGWLARGCCQGTPQH